MSRAMRLPDLRGAGGLYFGWWVVACAFLVATFARGVGFYEPSIFLAALHLKGGWPVSLISAAVTTHLLVSAGVVSQITRLHARLGLVAVTRLGAGTTAGQRPSPKNRAKSQARPCPGRAGDPVCRHPARPAAH